MGDGGLTGPTVATTGQGQERRLGREVGRLVPGLLRPRQEMTRPGCLRYRSGGAPVCLSV